MIDTKINGRATQVRPVDNLEAQELLNAGHTIYAHPSNMEVPTGCPLKVGVMLLIAFIFVGLFLRE